MPRPVHPHDLPHHHHHHPNHPPAAGPPSPLHLPSVHFAPAYPSHAAALSLDDFLFLFLSFVFPTLLFFRAGTHTHTHTPIWGRGTTRHVPPPCARTDEQNICTRRRTCVCAGMPAWLASMRAGLAGPGRAWIGGTARHGHGMGRRGRSKHMLRWVGRRYSTT